MRKHNRLIILAVVCALAVLFTWLIFSPEDNEESGLIVQGETVLDWKPVEASTTTSTTVAETTTTSTTAAPTTTTAAPKAQATTITTAAPATTTTIAPASYPRQWAPTQPTERPWWSERDDPLYHENGFGASIKVTSVGRDQNNDMTCTSVLENASDEIQYVDVAMMYWTQDWNDALDMISQSYKVQPGESITFYMATSGFDQPRYEDDHHCSVEFY